MQRITPCLWFDGQAEEAAHFYTSTFPNSRIGRISRYAGTAAERAGKPEGSVLTVEFQLDGQELLALNGGPQFQFNEALSLVVNCASQEEVDHYWEALSEGGEKGPCGWLKDRYGLSWQIVPTIVNEYMCDPDPQKVVRVMDAIMEMEKLDLAVLERAYSGE